MDTINLGVDDGLPPVDWEVIVERIADGSPPAPDAHNARTTWLTTLNKDGSPHVTAVGAVWLDGTFWFQTDPSGSGITAPFNAPSQGPPPWNVYRIEPRSATVALGDEPGGLTRFRF